jgi:DNA-binding LytR/AlgR family response regulator
MKLLLIMDEHEHKISILNALHEAPTKSELQIHLKYVSDFQLNNLLAPDLIILDLDFFGPLKLEQHLELISRYPIIFISSNPDSSFCVFKYKCIDFIRKPITKLSMHKAMLRFHFTNVLNDSSIEFDDILNCVNQKRHYKNKFIVNIGSSISTVDANNITFFYKKELIFLVDREGRKYITSYLSLDQIEKELDPKIFYRANRTQIINLQFIDNYINENDGKISLQLKTPQANNIRISKEKASSFRKWYMV